MLLKRSWLGLALVGACLAGGGTASAGPTTSLAQDYARLCADKAAASSETCITLRKALIAKLSAADNHPGPAETSGAARAPATTPPDQARQDELRQRWGVYADMVGKSFFASFDNGSYPSVTEYSWEMPGESIVATGYGATKTGEIERNAECPPPKTFRRLDLRTNQIKRTIANTCWPQMPAAEVIVQADGSVIETQIKGKYRDIIKRRPDGTIRLVREEFKKRSGTWERLGFGSTTSHERTPQFLASLRDRQRQLAQAQQQASGDNIVGRTLGGALMGAVLGGGGESSVELAVAGAQAAAQGGNTLEVLNSMGDVAAVRQAESARQLDETIARAQTEGLRQQAEEDEARRQAASESARRDAGARSQATTAATTATTAAADSAAQARAEREAAEAERSRLAEAARQKAKADKALKDAEALAAREKAAAEAKQRIEQQKRQDEAALVASFSGRATTCAGGGSGVLYLQTSRPAKSGCNVRFEARCPGTQPGNGVSFSQNNYIGGSCMGIGDAIQIGTMACPAEQVLTRMTGATCN